MSAAWVLGLALAAGYLINKNVQVSSQLKNSIAEYQNAAEPSTDGATSAEVRKAWANTDFTRYGDMAEELRSSQKVALDSRVELQRAQVEQFETAHVPSSSIQGVMLTFDGSGC
jgi:uncharacterized protein involved in exopolysaccharide biosynthesis